MVTLRGAIRSYTSTVRRIERNQQKRAREAAKFYKQLAKEQEIANAQEAVEKYNNYIVLIKSIHQECTDPVSWVQISSEPEPNKPELNSTHKDLAQEKLNSYKASLIDKLFGLEKKKTKQLEEAIQNAEARDKADYENSLAIYHEELANWSSLQELSNGVLAKDPDSYKKGLQLIDPFAEILEFGSKISLNLQSEFVIVDLHVKGNDLIPNYILSKTAAGKLSKKNMPISKFNELYQDYVCSCILRLAREILTNLPIEYVIINAKGELLNPATGHLEDQTIVSVKVLPSTLERLNFKTIDPSDSMKNFIHNMKFSKTNGFAQVEPIK